MPDWSVRLGELLGRDNDRKDAIDLLRMRTALTEDRLNATDRLSMLDWISCLDRRRQAFLLPALLDLLVDPALPVRQRMLTVVEEATATRPDLFRALNELVIANDSPAVTRTLEELERLLLVCTEQFTRPAPFATLPLLTESLLGLAALASVTRLVNSPLSSSDCISDVSRFLADDQVTPLIKAISECLNHGPLLHRCTAIAWLGMPGTDAVCSGPVATSLLHCYQEDLDPLVAGAAIESWARRVENSELDAAVAFLEGELTGLRTRELKWDSTDPAAALRVLGEHLLRALRTLAVNHFPATAPLAAVTRFLSATPQSNLDLINQQALTPSARKKIFLASTLIRRQKLQVLVQLDRDRDIGRAGFDEPLDVQFPRGRFPQYPRPTEVWVVPLPSSDNQHDPIKWTYRVVKDGSREPLAAADLYPIISPVLSQFSEGRVPSWPTPETQKAFQSLLEGEIEDRGAWMLEAGALAAAIVRKGFECGQGPDSPLLSGSVNYLTSMAIGTGLVRSISLAFPDRLKNLTYSICLNILARPAVFERLLPAGRSPEPFLAHLLVKLARSATVRALPGDPSIQWISANLEVLVAVVRDDSLPLRTRCLAITILHVHYLDLPGQIWDELAGIRFTPGDVFAKVTGFPAALCQLSDEDLALLGQPTTTGSVTGRALLLAIEWLARELERGNPSSDLAERGAKACLLIVDDEPVEPLVWLRLLRAFALCPSRLSGTARYLLPALLRRADASQLTYYFRQRSSVRSLELWEEHVRQVAMLLRDHQTANRNGIRGQFDQQGIRDRLARKRLLVRELAFHAARHRESFHRLYMSLHTTIPGRQVGPVFMAEGTMIQSSNPTGFTEVVGLINTPTNAGLVADHFGDGLVVFAYQQPALASMSCMLRGHPVPPGAIDFHSLPISPADRVRLLQHRLTKNRSAVLLGRVEHTTENGSVVIHLGVDAPGLGPRVEMVVEAGQPTQPDDSVLVEICPHEARLLAPLCGYPGDVVLTGLRSEKDPESGRRRWFARIGGRDIPVPRRNLTANIQTLFELDDLLDDHETLRRLASGRIAVRLDTRAEQGGLLDCPSGWNADDVLLAVLTGDADCLTVVDVAADGVLRAEVRLNRQDGIDSTGSLPAIGVIGALDSGSIFDQSGHPLETRRLKRGTLLPVRVVYGHFNNDGSIALDSDAGSEVSSPVLQLASEPSDPGEIAFSRFGIGEVVQVIVNGTPPELKLYDPPEGFPAPRVVVEVGSSSHFSKYATGTVAPALVDVAFHPSGEEYQLIVRAVRHTGLTIGDFTKDVPRYLRLDEGDLLPDHWRLSFSDDTWWFGVGGLKVRADPLLPYLLGIPLDSDCLNRSHRSVLIRLTRVGMERGRLLPNLTLPPELDGAATGLVARIPGRHDASARTVDIHWAQQNSTGESVSQLRPLAIGDARLSNGDVLEIVQGRSGHLEVWHYRRWFVGTLLHESVPFSEWSSKVRGGRFGSTFLHDDRSRGVWLFSIDPGHLIEVPKTVLGNSDRLANVWPLDRVSLLFAPAVPGKPAVLRVEITQHGPLRGSLSRPFELYFRRRHERTYETVLRGSDELRELGAIELQLVQSELPPHDRHDLERRPHHRIDITVPCILQRYLLDARSTSTPGRRRMWSFFFRPVWGAPADLDGSSQHDLAPVLEDELARWGGRLESVAGEVVSGPAVKLLDFNHVPLPLAEHEQTWIPHTGRLPGMGWQGEFVVIDRPGESSPVVSLRRRRPIPLTVWLRNEGATEPGMLIKRQLRYYGPMSPNDLRDCCLDDPEAIKKRHASAHPTSFQPPILFELDVGIAVIADQHQITFRGQPFGSRHLTRGDMVESIWVRRQGSELGIELAQITPDLCSQLRQFAHEKSGIFFGRVLEGDDGFDLKELRGANRRDLQFDLSQRGRRGLRLVKPGLEMSERLGRLARDQYVYLRLMPFAEEDGEIVFEILDPETACVRGNLVFVRGGEVQSEGLRVTLLGDSSNRDVYIPDHLYSARRGRINSARLKDEVFLAYVSRALSPAIRGQIVLSLVDVPARHFARLLGRGGDFQVILKQLNADGETVVEVEPGVHVKIPKLETADRSGFEPGDILLIRVVAESLRVELIDRLPGHLAWLSRFSPGRLTLITRLIGSIGKRRQQLRGGFDLNCKLSGLSLLAAVSRFENHRSIEEKRDLPQVFEGLTNDRRFVRMHEGTDRDSVVGQLFVSTTEPPVLVCHHQRLALTWDRVTVRHGHPSDLARELGELTWRTVGVRWPDDDLDRLSNSQLLARWQGNTASLTDLSDMPFPVEHLVEQFGPLVSQAADTARWFPIAHSGSSRLVLEISPGRYVELPTQLILPRASDHFADGRTTSWSHLTRGDLLLLQPTEGGAWGENLLPRFRVVSVRFGPGHLLRGPLWTTLGQGKDGSHRLGSSETGTIVDHLRNRWAAMKSPSTRGEVTVRINRGIWVRDNGPPGLGDEVLVGRYGQNNVVRVVGLEDYELRWSQDPRDPFDFDRAGVGAVVLAALPPHSPGLWVTVVGIDATARQLNVSRSRQLDRVWPTERNVASARVVGTLDATLLIDIGGIPFPLDSARFADGDLPTTAFSNAMSSADGGRGLEIEVTRVGDVLDAKSVYAEIMQEVEAVVEVASDPGLIVVAQGRRFFVPARELAWCELTGPNILALFPAGDRIRLHVGDSGGVSLPSHVRIRDIRLELTNLLAGVKEVGVQWLGQWIDREQGRAIVRSGSGLLMELQVEPGTKPEEWTVPRVARVDRLNHLAVVSTRSTTQTFWDLPRPGRQVILDYWSSDVVRMQVGKLQETLPSGPAAVRAWSLHQRGLAPSPRNLRLVLNAVAQFPDGDWGMANEDPKIPFAQVWSAVADALGRTVPSPTPAEPIVSFAVGYWMLLHGDAQGARPHLEAAHLDPALARHIDIPLVLAQAEYLCGENGRASERLNCLAKAVWVNASRTLLPPLLGPTELYIESDLPRRWTEAVGSGNGRDVSKLLREMMGGAFETSTLFARKVWDELLTEGTDLQLGSLTRRLSEVLHDEAIDGFSCDWRAGAMAIRLALARGDVSTSQFELMELPILGGAESAAARFWQSWLRGEDVSARMDVDPLLKALWAVLRQRWRSHCEGHVFEAIWDAYRTCFHNWECEIPTYRLLPLLPADPNKLEEWVDANGVQPLLSTLREHFNPL